MAKIDSIDVEVNCSLSVSRETAECCLKLVEIFLNSNEYFRIAFAQNDDGTQSLSLVDYEGWVGDEQI